MSAHASIAFNGKFLPLPATAIYKVAEELIAAFGDLLQDDAHMRAAIEAEVLAPRDTPSRQIDPSGIPVRRAGLLSARKLLWEQFDLPRLAGGRLVINLSNLGPILARRSITMIHDAQVFVTPESYPPHFVRLHRFVLPRLARKGNRILSISNSAARDIARYDIAPHDQITVIHNGVDHVLRPAPDNSVLQRLGLETRGFTLGLASLMPHKNIALLLDVFARDDMAEQKLVLFGSATAADFERSGSRVPQNVRFAGRVTDSELRALMEHAQAMLTPSRTEGFGLPPLEAMRLGTPAICAPCGALPEIGGDVAIFADPDDREAWARAILALNKPAGAPPRAALVEHAANFTWKRAATQLATVILEQADQLHARTQAGRP